MVSADHTYTNIHTFGHSTHVSNYLKHVCIKTSNTVEYDNTHNIFRLVMYIERDSRRQTPRDPKTDSAECFEYLNRCLDFLINYIVDCVPKIMSKFF